MVYQKKGTPTKLPTLPEEQIVPGMKKLRVIPGTVVLPYKINFRQVDYLFTPDCMIPCSEKDGFYADTLLTVKRNIFVEAKGKPELDKYKWDVKFQCENLASRFIKLTDEQRVQVDEFMESLKVEKPIDSAPITTSPSTMDGDIKPPTE